MAKSKELKRQEALVRSRDHFVHYLRDLLITCPLVGASYDTDDFAEFLDQWQKCRVEAKRIGLNWDGREIWSSCEDWVLEDFAEFNLQPDRFWESMSDIQKLVDDRHLLHSRFISHEAWLERFRSIKPMLVSEEIKEVIKKCQGSTTFNPKPSSSLSTSSRSIGLFIPTIHSR